MKQATIKTLGTALLGVAFAATATGSASAIDVGQLGGTLNKLPVKQAAKTVSGVSKDAHAATGDIKATPNAKGNRLLGGLPTNALGKVLGG